MPTASKWHGKTLELIELRWYNGHAVGFFKGVDDRTEAETLIKAILWVSQDAQELPDEDDAWYDHQLVGLDAVRDGVTVGRVARVDHLPAQDLLAIKTAGRRGARAVREGDRARGRPRRRHGDAHAADRALRRGAGRRPGGRSERSGRTRSETHAKRTSPTEAEQRPPIRRRHRAVRTTHPPDGPEQRPAAGPCVSRASADDGEPAGAQRAGVRIQGREQALVRADDVLVDALGGGIRVPRGDESTISRCSSHAVVARPRVRTSSQRVRASRVMAESTASAKKWLPQRAASRDVEFGPRARRLVVGPLRGRTRPAGRRAAAIAVVGGAGAAEPYGGGLDGIAQFAEPRDLAEVDGGDLPARDRRARRGPRPPAASARHAAGCGMRRVRISSPRSVRRDPGIRSRSRICARSRVVHVRLLGHPATLLWYTGLVYR